MNDVELLNEHLKGLEIIIGGVRKIRTEYADKTKPLSLMIIDAQLFLYLQSYDLTAYHKNYSDTNFEFEKKLFCRLLALYFNEFAEDTLKLLGKPFRKALTEKIPEINLDELNGLKQKIVWFQSTYGPGLNIIRNEVIAHREHNPLKQIEVIENIDLTTFMGHVATVYQLSMDIINCLGRLLEQVEKAEEQKTPK